MSDWKNSMYAQIAYMAGMGLAFLFAPNILLPLLGLEPTSEIWIRILGMLVLALTFYYWTALNQNQISFARVSVWGRLAFCAGLAILGVMFGQYIFIGFAVLEAGLALWTHRTLPKEG